MSLDDAYANAAYIPDAERFLTYWDETARNYREAEHMLGPGTVEPALWGASRPSFLIYFFPQDARWG